MEPVYEPGLNPEAFTETLKIALVFTLSCVLSTEIPLPEANTVTVVAPVADTVTAVGALTAGAIVPRLIGFGNAEMETPVTVMVTEIVAEEVVPVIFTDPV
jgi:hypothetical protein